jgi:chemotaxis protein MotB
MKKFFFGILTSILLSSCVSSKIYEDLKGKYDNLKTENESLMSQLDDKGGDKDEYSINQLKKEVEKLTSENSRLKMDLEASKNNYDRIKSSYDALEENSSSSLTENLKLNRKLLEQLEEKEKELVAESKRLEQLKKDLASRSKRVEELESILASKDAKMKSLKDAISAALTNFEGNGLTVEHRDGKVYVSMENKLLFESGSWSVNPRGREAVLQLGKVLAKNPEIAVLIEGHTDNVAYGGNGPLKDNWDLSTKRATAIVTILSSNQKIIKENLTAAGRSEFAPIDSNASFEGRAKNRRIEVILTPKLDEISKLLNEI